MKECNFPSFPNRPGGGGDTTDNPKCLEYKLKSTFWYLIIKAIIQVIIKDYLRWGLHRHFCHLPGMFRYFLSQNQTVQWIIPSVGINNLKSFNLDFLADYSKAVEGIAPAAAIIRLFICMYFKKIRIDFRSSENAIIFSFPGKNLTKRIKFQFFFISLYTEFFFYMI